MLSDLTWLRRRHPSLKLLVSLGGRAVKASVFAAVAADKHRMRNLTDSIDRLHSRGDRPVIDGVEIDWEWPTAGGDEEDRDSLVRYARVRCRGRTVNCSYYVSDGARP